MNLIVREGAISDFELKVCDKRKKDIDEPIYFNAGYFALLGSGATIPVGNLVVNGSIITDSATQPAWLNTARHKLTTLVIHNNNTMEFVRVDNMNTVPAVKFAISGIPIIRNGCKVSLEEIKSEGYFGNELYDTWHGFLGVRQGKLAYVRMKCAYSDMYSAMVELGISDAIKLDGGGSFIDKYNNDETATSENRRINNIGILRLRETEQSKGSGEGMKIIALDAGHGMSTAGKEITLSGYPKTKEWYLNDRISDRVEELLSDYECKVVRVGDTTGKRDISLRERVKTANNVGATAYISVHHNAGINGGSGGGTIVYYYSGNSARKVQAQRLYDSIISKTGLVGNRSSKVIKYGFDVLRNTNMPAFLIENGFMDSTTDVPIILSPEHAEKTARGILEFLVKEYSLKKKKVVEGGNFGKYEGLADDCKLLASKGIINSPDYWAKGEGYSDENTVLLINKFASYVRGA